MNLHSPFHKRNEPVRLYKKIPLKNRLNQWCMRNIAYIALATLLLSLIIFLLFSFIIVGASLESGNYYNHLEDVVL